MNYRKHRRQIEKTYEDKATISRYGKVKKPNGETKNELSPVCVDQPCRISQKALAVNGQREAQNEISYETSCLLRQSWISGKVIVLKLQEAMSKQHSQQASHSHILRIKKSSCSERIRHNG
ncbi:ABC transporter ATP-binding protein [Paenibacillus alvei]|uniref:hypothetical protein n=1 Tax=Paenibacillus alvei TaxID=44250 RepID=UPI00028822F8|nr:hypothetical protein [Paenibacillus alvei]EJW14726.1 hypothetical protein PAV_11c00670 [Paenibacillus alvei DSM 29]MCY9540923.1 ABC transporter ATP-binding protein [Paenibacillus alvei]MCY9708173.1 ABC transporter ATP-binding protein [Paenibacillus alvei]MEC0080194.1 ABC transporter ATP-binding protein [Paenibacillus alvei]